MNKEQEKFWNALSHNYPSKRSCNNCAHYTKPSDGIGCIIKAGRICDIYYSKDDWARVPFGKTEPDPDPGPQRVWEWDMK